jgi:hypothetical protein
MRVLQWRTAAQCSAAHDVDEIEVLMLITIIITITAPQGSPFRLDSPRLSSVSSSLQVNASCRAVFECWPPAAPGSGAVPAPSPSETAAASLTCLFGTAFLSGASKNTRIQPPSHSRVRQGLFCRGEGEDRYRSSSSSRGCDSLAPSLLCKMYCKMVSVYCGQWPFLQCDGQAAGEMSRHEDADLRHVSTNGVPTVRERQTAG